MAENKPLEEQDGKIYEYHIYAYVNGKWIKVYVTRDVEDRDRVMLTLKNDGDMIKDYFYETKEIK